MKTAIAVATMRLPHVRGGVSTPFPTTSTMALSSPRAWGCFYPVQPRRILRSVFPTCVGVFLFSDSSRNLSSCLPHVRGGVSDPDASTPSKASSSPRAWGCFSRLAQLRHNRLVFPTCVGVFPVSGGHVVQAYCLPHVRGGVSIPAANRVVARESSPRAWGCFRTESILPDSNDGLPHVRGGVSLS